MSLSECMAKHTYRQYTTWMAWFATELNKPSRSDHYLMQVAMEVRSVLAKDPKKIKLKQFKIPFELVTEGSKPKYIESTQAAKSRWCAGVGLKIANTG